MKLFILPMRNGEGSKGMEDAVKNVNGKIKMQEKLQIKMYKNVHKNGILTLEFELGKGGERYRR